jgi:hypothetical protein
MVEAYAIYPFATLELVLTISYGAYKAMKTEAHSIFETLEAQNIYFFNKHTRTYFPSC